MKKFRFITLLALVALLSSCGGGEAEKKEGTAGDSSNSASVTPEKSEVPEPTEGTKGLTCDQLMQDLEAIGTEYKKLADHYYDTGELDNGLLEKLEARKRKFDLDWEANSQLTSDMDCVMRFTKMSTSFSEGAIRMSEAAQKHHPN